MRAEEAFLELASAKKWVPYRMVWNPQREKFDKIPYNGKRRLSTKAPDDWIALGNAAETAHNSGLSGVGLVMTGGVTRGDKLLVGFDFDAVDFDNFQLPFDTYAEISPSKTGVRAFAWVPKSWAEPYDDTTRVLVDFCSHAEVYIGSAPRFLTVTFNPYNVPKPIADLTEEDLSKLGRWLKASGKAMPMMVNLPEKLGQAVDLAPYMITPEYSDLVKGTGDIDRSSVLHSMIIKMVDTNVAVEDVLATVVETPELWRVCMDHRSQKEDKAFQFAQEEVLRAYNRSKTGMLEAVTRVNREEIKKEVSAKQEDLTFPSTLFTEAKGLVGEVARWIIDASFAPREEFAIACALSLVSCLIGPYCTFGSRGGKMNMYFVMVGETGTGKNEAMDTMCDLLAATEARDCIIDFPASEAGMRRQLNVTPNLMLRVDELAHKLDSMQGQNGASLGRAVLEAYNGARMPPKVYADEKKTLPAVDNPYVQIIGGTTHRVWDVLKTTHLEDGTLNRFIFVCLPLDPPYRRNLEPNTTIPKPLVDKLNIFWRDGKRFDLLGYVPPGFGRKITVTETVKRAQQELDKEVWGMQKSDFGGLYTRYVQNALKIAAIMAVGEGKTEITMEHFDYGKRFMAWCLANTYYHAYMRMADSHFERHMKRLLDKLNKSGGVLSVREAYRFLHMSRRETEELLATLHMAGEIDVVTDSGNENMQTIILKTDEREG